MIEQSDIVEFIGFALGSFAIGYVSSALLLAFKKATGFLN